MESIQFWANMAAIVGVPIAITGLIISFHTLRVQIKQCERKIATFTENINLQNQYYSRDARYHDCTFNFSKTVVSPGQIKQEYHQGLNKEDENA